MSKFETLRDALIRNYNEKISGKKLFMVDVRKDVIWNLYLDSFPAGTNEVYRKRRQHDCSCCHNFIREVGNLVWIDDEFRTHSIFEFDAGDPIFQVVMDALSRKISSKPIVSLYLYNGRTHNNTIGTPSSLEHTEAGGVNRWKHFYLPLNEKNVFIKGRNSWMRDDTIGGRLSEYNSTHDVFKRSLEEITEDAVDTLLELIASKNLYRGEEWKNALEKFKLHQMAINVLTPEQKENYYWEMCDSAGPEVTRIRNHSIGVLLQDLSAGVDLEEAIRKYEAIVAPANYKRPKPLFTRKMLERARKTVEELGLTDSLPRRFAVMDDIPVQNVHFSNKDAQNSDITSKINTVWDDMSMDAKAVAHSQFQKMMENARQVPVDAFVNAILPLSEEVEVFLESKHEKNLMSLIAPVNVHAPSMFKWSNGFSWAYNGNLASSDIRQNVKEAGGKVDGALRFSIMWNGDGHCSNDDLDAHCDMQRWGGHIYYARKHDSTTGGELDVDIIKPLMDRPGKPAVESIVFPNKNNLLPSGYNFFVKCYTNRGGIGGFKAEIEFDGNVYHYEYPNLIPSGVAIPVATVIVDPNKNMTIKHHLKPTSGRWILKIWGIPTNHFVPVTTICDSPNYWGENRVGAHHLFFMLKDCKNPDTPNGFFNEYLRNDLNDHRKVFEALGSRMKVQPSDNQLSGLGFNMTEQNELLVKVKGKANQVIKVIF